jgi:uncharacterized protein (TIGR02246 family)
MNRANLASPVPDLWKTNPSPMRADNPDDLHRLFAQGINAGDAHGVASLYEEDAILVSTPEKIVRGREAILDGLLNFLRIKPKMTLNAARILRNGDIAILYSDWTIEGRNLDGSRMSVTVRPTLVARRQADGAWLVAIDDPSTDSASSEG